MIFRERRRWTWDTWEGPSMAHFFTFPIPFVYGWRTGPLIPRSFAWGAGSIVHPLRNDLSTRVPHVQLGQRVYFIGLQNWKERR